MTESDDLIREFLIESHEGLDRLDQDLVDLEKAPRNRETLGSVFRAIHTIKGTCGFLGFTKLEGVSHVGESLLSCLRDGDTVLDAPITTALFGMVDAIREILASIERTGRAMPTTPPFSRASGHSTIAAVVRGTHRRWLSSWHLSRTTRRCPLTIASPASRTARCASTSA